MLTVGGLGAAGDSLTDEYLDPDQNLGYAITWFEALGASGVNVGDLRVAPDNWGDVREEGYEFNWAQAGATSGSLLGDGQHLGLAGQVSAGDVTHAVLAIGQNDYWPLGSAYQGIYAGTWTQAQIETHNQGILTNIETAVDTLMATGVDLVLSNVIDYGVAPLVRALAADPVGRQRVADAIGQLNFDVAALAAKQQIPLVDSFALTKTYLGVHGSEIPSQQIGGVEIANTGGVDAHNAFTADGVHPHTTLQAVHANCYVEALNAGYAAGLAQFTELEILTLAGIGGEYTGDTLDVDYSQFVSTEYDWGDAPAPYPTQSPDGAVHPMRDGFCLGVLIDGEADGQPSVAADGDDTDNLDDEDGGPDPGALFQGGPVDLTVYVTDTSGEGGYLDAWIDLNRDGDWEDTEEWFLQEQVSDGANLFPLVLPLDVPVGQTYARFRLSAYHPAVEPGGGGTPGEVEDYRVTIVTEDLGTIEYEQLEGLDLSAGELWYRMQTSGPGFLSLLAAYTPEGGDCELTLFDAQGDEIATSGVGSGMERVEHEAAGAGEVYFARLRGTNTDVDLHLLNLVADEGTTVNVRGTAGPDVLEVTIMPDPVLSSFTINGFEYNFHDLGASALTFDGGGGDDTMLYNGTSGVDKASLRPDRAWLQGGGITVTAWNVEETTADGGGGDDDVAVLRDSPGGDTFTAYVDRATMTYEAGNRVEAANFRWMHGRSTEGGADVAELYDQTVDLGTSHPVWLDARPDDSRMYSAGYGFLTRVRGFAQVSGNATGDDDVAVLRDSPGGDTFTAYVDRATMTYEAGNRVEANNFRWMHGRSTEGGADVAELYDQTDDLGTSHPVWLVAKPDDIQMYSAGYGFFTRVRGFAQVAGNATGGDDVAVLRDSPGVDTFTAYVDRASITYEAGSRVEAANFRWMHGRSAEGGADVAELYDQTVDMKRHRAVWLDAKPDDSRMYSAGYEIFMRVKGFNRVTARAYRGFPNDVAVLRDSPGGDTFTAYADRATMTYEAGNSVEAIDFRWMHGRSNEGGADVAELYDRSYRIYDGEPEMYPVWFVAKPDDSRMYSAEYGFFMRVIGFGQVTGNATRADDVAYLYDSPDDDVFDGYFQRVFHWGTMTYGAGSVVCAAWFGSAHYAVADEHDDNDTANLYENNDWELIGDWETINNVIDVDSFGTGANQFTLAFVPISGSSNPLLVQCIDGFGIVEYDYRIGKYEITNDQWNKFVAELGVPVTGSEPYSYDKSFYDYGTGTTDVPANNVSWFEAAQFVNWLNTSTGHHAAYNFTGTQGQSDYTFATWDLSEAWGGNLYRHKDALYFLPDDDEWYKAAYWGSRIQDYATKPGETLFQGDGVSGTGWNYYDSGHATDPYGPWDVGSGSEELNGTYDMMGNQWEMMEGYGVGRGIRGGNWYDGAISCHRETRGGGGAESDHVTFRVASRFPGPAT